MTVILVLIVTLAVLWVVYAVIEHGFGAGLGKLQANREQAARPGRWDSSSRLMLTQEHSPLVPGRRRAPSDHPLYASHIALRANVGLDRLLEIAEQVATEVRGVGLYRGGSAKVRLAQDTETARTFSVGAGTSNLNFVVHGWVHDEVTSVVSDIIGYRMRQEQFLGFIPVGPKEMLGYHFYRQFMLDFGEAVQQEDPAATVEVMERSIGSDVLRLRRPPVDLRTPRTPAPTSRPGAHDLPAEANSAAPDLDDVVRRAIALQKTELGGPPDASPGREASVEE